MTGALVILAGVLVALEVTAFVRERAWARERADLLQRIQAPERAVADHSRRDEPKPRYRVVALEDDDAMLNVLGQEVDHDDGP